METINDPNVIIDFAFNSKQPKFGDLFTVVGYENPNFPSSTDLYLELADLNFEQIDHFFGIKNEDDAGGEIVIWLIPIKNGIEVHHDEGPFDSIRLTYNALTNKADKIEHLRKCFELIVKVLDVKIFFNGQEIDSFDPIQGEINKIINYFREVEGIEPGSDESMEIDF